MSIEARIIDTADAAVAQIADGVAAQLFAPHRFTPERSYASWDETLKAADKLQVDVVPSRYERSELASRTRHAYLVSIEIYVRLRFDSANLKDGKPTRGQIDCLVRLVEQLHELFAERKRPPADTTVSWESGQIITACSRPHLRDKLQFFGAIKEQFNAPRTFEPTYT